MVKNIKGEIYSDLITSSRPESFWGGGIRPISAVRKILIHGIGGTNKEGIWSTWKVGSNRQASAHYVCTPDEIIGCVGENYIAWHSGGLGAINNYNTIGVEHINSKIGDINDASTYLFDPKTIENGAMLVADICKRLGIQPNSQNIIPHRAVSATSCPQTLDMAEYVKLVQDYYYGRKLASSQTQIENKGVYAMRIITFKENIDGFKKDGMYLFNFNRGTYNHLKNAEEVKFVEKAYKEANGTDIPHETASKAYPCHVRYIEGFNLIDIDK